jgi:hypothetical protein
VSIAEASKKGPWLGIFQGLADPQVLHLFSERTFDDLAGDFSDQSEMGGRLHFSSVHTLGGRPR